MTNLFVDTGSTAGGDGTTGSLVGANRAFASLQEALDSLVAIVTLADAYTITLRATGGGADTLACTQTHWNFHTSATHNVLITVDPAHRHAGVYNTAKYRLEIADSSAIYCNLASHVHLDGLQIKLTGTTSTSATYNAFRLSTANNADEPIDQRFSDCIAQLIQSGTDHVQGFVNSGPPGGTGTCRLWNCLAYSPNGSAFLGYDSDGSAWAAANLTYYNCSAVNIQIGYVDTGIQINCLAALSSSGDFISTGSTGSSHNASSDGSAPGTSSRTSQTFIFRNAAANDYHLDAKDVGARGGGLTDPGSGLFSDDIDGETRTVPWDIGADQFIPIPTMGYTKPNHLRPAAFRPGLAR